MNPPVAEAHPNLTDLPDPLLQCDMVGSTRGASDQPMPDVRHVNRPIELIPKKPTIKVGSMDHLVATLEQVREAVAAGELDKLMRATKVRRKRGLTADH
jgi:hypothetical protein